MRDTRACRACLDTDGRLETIPDNWYRMFENLTGIQVSKTDGYPNYFCIECKAHIHKAIAFRKKCRRAFYVLKEIMLVRKEVNLPDIKTVNRASMNLKSSLDMWKPETTALYVMKTVGEHSILVRINSSVVKSRSVLDIKGQAQEAQEFPEHPELPQEHVEDIPPLPTEDDHFNQADDHFDDYSQDIEDIKEKQKEEQKEEQKEIQKEEQKEELEEIDMEDIFKGLPEPESEPESEAEDVKKKKKKVKKKRGLKKVKKVKKKAYSALAKGRALINFDVEEISEEEQREAFKSRTSNPIFTRSLYTCGICVKVMPSAESLMAHFDVHMKKSNAQFLCKICKDKFVTAEDFELHNKENHLYKYTCKICNDVTYTVRDMVRHKKEKHVEKYTAPKEDPSTRINYEALFFDKYLLIPIPDDEKEAFFKNNIGVGKFCCDMCGIGFPTAPLRQLHREMHLRKPKKPEHTARKQCPLCGVWCKVAVMQRHMESFHDYNFHCKLCSYEAPNRSLAEDHLTRVHSKLTNTCHVCGLGSKTVEGLKVHLAYRHYGVVRGKCCVLCGNGFKTDFSLYNHQFKEHKFFRFAQPPVEGAENACAHCNVQFVSQRAYYNHLVKFNHEEVKIVPWKCMTCRRMFDSEAELREHSIKTCKLCRGSFPAPCQVCGEMFLNNQEYYLHCLRKHNRDAYLVNRGMLCDVCGRMFTKKQWSRHECNSANYAKYKCSMCDILFHKAKKVFNHVLQKHMKKPFICSICNAAFRRRYDCKDHILKVHAPVRHFACPLCSKEFSHIDFLKKHALELHGVKVELDGKPKKKDFLYIYPNMKMDLSLIDKAIIDEMVIKVADYTDQIYETIQDYSDYIITNEDERRKLEEEVKDCKNFIISAEALRRSKREEQDRKFMESWFRDETKECPTNVTRQFKFNIEEESNQSQDSEVIVINAEVLRRKQQEPDRKYQVSKEVVVKKERPTTSKLSRPQFSMPSLDMEGDNKDIIKGQKRKHQDEQDRKYLKEIVVKKRKEQPSTSTPSHLVYYDMPTLEVEEDQRVSYRDPASTSVLSRHLEYKGPQKKNKLKMFDDEF